MEQKPFEDSTFEAEFYRRVEMIKERAKAAGTNITQLCRIAEVSRTTPERWEKRVPKSITILDQMFNALLDIEAERRAKEDALKNLPPRERERLRVQEEERQKEEERMRRERRNETRRLSRMRRKDSNSNTEEE